MFFFLKVRHKINMRLPADLVDLIVEFTVVFGSYWIRHPTYGGLTSGRLVRVQLRDQLIHLL